MTKLIQVLKVAIPVFLLLILSTQVAMAGYKYQYANVKRYYPSGEHSYFTVDAAILNPAGCSKPIYYTIESSHQNFEDYKRLLLTAKASGYKVGFYIYDNVCFGNYPKIYRMFVE